MEPENHIGLVVEAIIISYLKMVCKTPEKQRQKLKRTLHL